jgi:hypothetical protein
MGAFFVVIVQVDETFSQERDDPSVLSSRITTFCAEGRKVFMQFLHQFTPVKSMR